MLFNSLDFLWFFPAVVVGYFLLPVRLRWILLLGASYLFYGWHIAPYLLILAGSTTVDYVVARAMAATADQRHKKCWLAVSVCTNLGVLFLFKYFDFFAHTVQELSAAGWQAPALGLALPVGISFYTFQTLSYSIDVYRGVRAPERHLGIFALYVSFFPQLVAGPIERSTSLLPQLRKAVRFVDQRVWIGLLIMGWGFFKKLVIADRLAVVVNQVYGAPEEFGGAVLLLATYAFAYQIFCDFSGYTDIARGAARVFGYKLSPNFDAPYLSTSIRDFWNRWHISLTTFFRDYLFYPLCFARHLRLSVGVALMVTFVLSGLWHGANWTFVIWGALHGLYLAVEELIRGRGWRLGERLRLPTSSVTVGKALLTFNLVAAAWVFFRAESLADALLILRGIGAGLDLRGLESLGLALPNVLLLLLALVLMETLHYFERQRGFLRLYRATPVWGRWLIYATVGWAILLFGVFGEVQFIYFLF